MAFIAINGATAGCGTKLVAGSTTVLINQKPIGLAGDLTKHGGSAPAVVSTSETTVKVEGKLVYLIGDAVATHSYPKPEDVHPGQSLVSTSNSTVSIG